MTGEQALLDRAMGPTRFAALGELLSFEFVNGKGFDRASVKRFHANAIALLGDLVADLHGRGLRSTKVSSTERDLLFGFRELDESGRQIVLAALDLARRVAPDAVSPANEPPPDVQHSIRACVTPLACAPITTPLPGCAPVLIEA